MKERLFSPVNVVSIEAPPFVSRGSTRTGKLLGLLGGDCTEVSQIALVTNQHDHNIRVSVVTQLLQPPVDIVVGLVLADIVDEEGTDGATVVGRGDGPVALLTSSIPNLCLDGLRVDLDRTSRKLHADGGLGVQVELVAGETTQQVGFTDTRVSDQHHCPAVSLSVIERRAGCRQGGVRRYPHQATLPLKRNWGRGQQAKQMGRLGWKLTSYSSLAMVNMW